MKRKFSIYLAGTIKKGKEEEKEEAWTQLEKTFLKNSLPSIELVFLDPSIRSDNLSDQCSVFGRDMFQVFSSNLVLVDGRGKRGLGVGAEMMFAKHHSIPVMTWTPRNSYYHRTSLELLGQTVDEWIHPFVFSLSDFVVANLEEATRIIEHELLSDRRPIKGPEWIQGAMQYYLEKSLSEDHYMDKMVKEDSHISNKVESVMSNANLFANPIQA